MGDILDYIWFLIKVMGSLVILMFLCSLFVNLILDSISRSNRRRNERIMEEALKEAIKKGDFQVGVIDKDDLKNIDKK